MIRLTDYPLLVFAVATLLLALSAWFGAGPLRRWRPLDSDVVDDFRVVQGAMLTLLGLIIGFTFSMAISRFDQRKNLEEGEANAIGTEYVRADLLPAAEGAKVRTLLRAYTEERIRFYTARGREEESRINVRTAQLQNELWAAIVPAASANPNQLMALVLSGMNDVLNSQGYAQAAWWNRIPPAAWLLMLVIAMGCCVSVGYGSRDARRERWLMLAVPFIVAISFFSIADIDSPRSGVIRVAPQNLQSLADSMAPKK
jgi:hypothetical protein